MGVSLRTAAQYSAQDFFDPWDPLTNTFLPAQAVKGRLFRADRFTPIYHRPTRRTFLGVQSGNFPASGTVRRRCTNEVYFISETLKTEVLHGKATYDQLRVAHLATEPSGGLGEFYSYDTSGTGNDLGPVAAALPIATYIDMELQSSNLVEESVDSRVSACFINHSAHLSPREGDFFLYKGRWHLIKSAYVDGGFRVTRTDILEPAYSTFTYKLHAGVGSYSPVTGVVTEGTVDREFSGLIGRHLRDGEIISKPSDLIELYVYKRHIGFEPRIGDNVFLGTTKFTIMQVLDRREDFQWRLELKR